MVELIEDFLFVLFVNLDAGVNIEFVLLIKVVGFDVFFRLGRLGAG